MLTARPGTTLAEIDARLAQHGQALAFEPPDLGPVLGAGSGLATLGGCMAANLSGPRRFKAGAPRDHILRRPRRQRARRAVQIGRPGGQERHRLRPLQAARGLLGYPGRDDRDHRQGPAGGGEAADGAGLRARRPGGGRSDDPRGSAGRSRSRGAAHLAGRDRCALGRRAGSGSRLFRHRAPASRGRKPSVLARTSSLRALFADGHAIDELHGHNSNAFWRRGRRGPLPRGRRGDCLAASRCRRRRARQSPAGSRTRSRPARSTTGGGGLVWLALPPGTEDAGAEAVRAALGPAGGHVTLDPRAGRGQAPRPRLSPAGARPRGVETGG